MLLHASTTHTLIFGDQASACTPQEQSFTTQASHFQKFLGTAQPIFARQVHGTQGLVITPQTPFLKSFEKEADFLITNRTDVALGTVTADCLPIIMYDPVRHVLGAAHAGWSGTINNIAVIMLQELTKNFDTQPHDVLVYFGPCASVNNYEVSANFRDKLVKFDFIDSVFVTKNEKFFFNMPLCNQLLLERAGVVSSNICSTYNHCTLSNNAYCSHRRNPLDGLRNITLSVLR